MPGLHLSVTHRGLKAVQPNHTSALNNPNLTLLRLELGLEPIKALDHPRKALSLPPCSLESERRGKVDAGRQGEGEGGHFLSRDSFSKVHTNRHRQASFVSLSPGFLIYEMLRYRPLDCVRSCAAPSPLQPPTLSLRGLTGHRHQWLPRKGLGAGTEMH